MHALDSSVRRAERSWEEGSRVLKVGLDANFPPFEYYQKGTDNFTGFDVELMRGVAANMGYSGVEFVNTGLNDLINGLNGKRYDVIASGFSVTPERQQAVDFSESYLSDGFRICLLYTSPSPRDRG